MPAEWAAHDRTLLAWPARMSLWGELWEDAQAVYAEVANAIAAFVWTRSYIRRHGST